LDEEKSKYAGLALENGLSFAYLQSSRWLVKGTATSCTSKKECNKYHLTAAQCFPLSHQTDWSRWFAISSPPHICCPSFSFMGGVEKQKLDVKNISAGSHTEHRWRCF